MFSFALKFEAVMVIVAVSPADVVKLLHLPLLQLWLLLNCTVSASEGLVSSKRRVSCFMVGCHCFGSSGCGWGVGPGLGPGSPGPGAGFLCSGCGCEGCVTDWLGCAPGCSLGAAACCGAAFFSGALASCFGGLSGLVTSAWDWLGVVWLAETLATAYPVMGGLLKMLPIFLKTFMVARAVPVAAFTTVFFIPEPIFPMK